MASRAIPFRDAILRSGNNKCQLCEEMENLEVHHLKHELSGGKTYHLTDGEAIKAVREEFEEKED